MADKPTKGSRAETAVGAGALATGVGVRPVAFRRYNTKRSNLEARKAAAQNYLSQGGKAKRDPSKKGLNTQKKKAALREVNVVGRELKNLKAPTNVNRTKVWLPLTAGGAAMTWHGGRKEFGKKASRKDADAAALGAAGGIAAHQGAGLGFTLRRMKVMDAHQGADRAKVKAYNKTALPKGGMKTGDPNWKKYWRNYPKDVPGGKTARVLSRTHGGKTGAAVLLGSATAGGATGVAVSRKKDKVTKRDMSDKELRRRKKAQGAISRTTSTLGLGGLGLLGASVAMKKPGTLKRIQAVHPKLANTSPEKVRSTANNVALVSGGIGGLGGYNFASYTAAEAKQKKFKKSDDASPFEDGFYGSEGKPLSRTEIESAFAD